MLGLGVAPIVVGGRVIGFWRGSGFDGAAFFHFGLAESGMGMIGFWEGKNPSLWYGSRQGQRVYHSELARITSGILFNRLQSRFASNIF
jgi:hypothetical protein